MPCSASTSVTKPNRGTQRALQWPSIAESSALVKFSQTRRPDGREHCVNGVCARPSVGKCISAHFCHGSGLCASCRRHRPGDHTIFHWGVLYFEKRSIPSVPHAHCVGRSDMTHAADTVTAQCPGTVITNESITKTRRKTHKGDLL